MFILWKRVFSCSYDHHHDQNIDTDVLVDIFVRKHPHTRMGFASPARKGLSPQRCVSFRAEGTGSLVLRRFTILVARGGKNLVDK